MECEKKIFSMAVRQDTKIDNNQNQSLVFQRNLAPMTVVVKIRQVSLTKSLVSFSPLRSHVLTPIISSHLLCFASLYIPFSSSIQDEECKEDSTRTVSLFCRLPATKEFRHGGTFSTPHLKCFKSKYL